MPDAPGLTLQSQDQRFAIELPGSRLAQVFRLCQEAGVQETGGILLGYYTPSLDCAIVTQISGPPPDSHGTSNRFYRGIAGLQRLIDRLWRRRRHYYLGEWHYHPLVVPDASPDDESQMAEIAASPTYNCPEPLLLIIGGAALSGWMVRAYVYTTAKGLTVLQ